MKLAVTIVKPHGYAHSEAFREVAQSLQVSLTTLGHDCVLTHELSLTGRQHVVLGAHLLDTALAPDAIIYNLEQVQPGAPWLSPSQLQLLKSNPVWDYSLANIAKLGELGVRGVRHVPIGYVSELTRIAPASEEDLDVLFVGSTNPRRLEVLKGLRAKGLKVHLATGVYGAARDGLIARAKVVLNVHYYQARVFEVVRVSYLLANRRFVVSERGVDAYEELFFAQGVAFAEYGDLVETCARFVAQPDERRRIADSGFELMRSRSAAEALRCALAATPSARVLALPRGQGRRVEADPVLAADLGRVDARGREH